MRAGPPQGLAGPDLAAHQADSQAEPTLARRPLVVAAAAASEGPGLQTADPVAAAAADRRRRPSPQTQHNRRGVAHLVDTLGALVEPHTTRLPTRCPLRAVLAPEEAAAAGAWPSPTLGPQPLVVVAAAAALRLAELLPGQAALPL